MESIKEVFFNNTLRRWHFEDIVKESGMSRERANFYLKRLVTKGLVRRVKPKAKMPYYEAKRDSVIFRMEKRMHGLSLIQQSGLFNHINSLEDVKTAILFGSFSRGDFDTSSDIDLFIYGDTAGFEKGKFENRLGREIQLFDFRSLSGMRQKLDEKLAANIIKGFNIKGTLEPFRVILDAKGKNSQRGL